MERIFVFLRSPGSATAVLLGATLIALIVANSLYMGRKIAK